MEHAMALALCDRKGVVIGPGPRAGTPGDIAGEVLFAVAGPFATGTTVSADSGEPLA
jgi:hypothetical protein